VMTPGPLALILRGAGAIKGTAWGPTGKLRKKGEDEK
jgi:hypothetical protein